MEDRNGRKEGTNKKTEEKTRIIAKRENKKRQKSEEEEEEEEGALDTARGQKGVDVLVLCQLNSVDC